MARRFESEGNLSKYLLNVSIVLSGILLGVLHYALKPAPSKAEIAQYAEGMTNSTEWQGQIAPDFELKTVSGERFRLSENVGKKIIVLNFFATWCGPCREEMPELNRYFNEHKTDSFLLVGIDAEEKTDRVEEFLDELKVDFPAGIDEGAIQKEYGVSGLPTTVLIGVDGRVQFYEAGALENADVAFDRLLQVNRQLLKAGRAISTDDYRLQAQKQTALPVRRTEQTASTDEAYKFDSRAKRIVARMDCPCGCEKKVHDCTCNTSTKIKKALVTEDFEDKPDDEIMRSLNKRFCMGAM